MKSLFKKLNSSKVFKDLNEQEFSWVLYDVGNSAFTMLGCSLIPIWFHSLADNAIGLSSATGMWALGTSIVTIFVAIIGPICGTFADQKDRKKIFFTTAVSIGVIGCIINGFATSWALFLVIYILTKVAYSASLTFYDSMLVDVTSEDRMDEVSSYGYAWGYIGSCIPFTLALIAYILGPDMVGLISGFVSKGIGFLITACWWAIVTLPLIRNYKQVHYVDSEKGEVKKGFSKIFQTLKTIVSKDKKVLFFLIAFFLYIDGVGTIIDNCVNIGIDLGLNTVGQVIFLLLTQVVAWLGSLVFAKLSRKHETVNLILVCIVGYFAVCVYALTLKELWQFGIMAFGVGCFQGSIQSLSRSYYTKIIPSENSSEYFGIYDIFAKGASFLGSAVIALVKFNGGTINVAVGLLTIFFGLGFIFLKIADKYNN